jgi:hypothetical protein
MTYSVKSENAAVRAADKSISLSGDTYVSAMLREDIGKYPLRNHLVRLPVTSLDDCEHCVTVCAKWDCIESWSCDYRLFLDRTGAGRKIAEEVGWDASKDIPADKGRVPDPKQS